MRTLALLFAVTAFAACGRFAPDRNLKRHASPSEIVGTWRLLPSSLEVLKREAHYSAAELARPFDIVFRGDGTCRIRSAYEVHFLQAEYFDVECTWKLVHDPPFDRGKANELQIKVNRRVLTFNLTEKKHHLHLWEFWADPDEGQLMEYEKT